MKKLQKSTKRSCIGNRHRKSVLFTALSIVIILATLVGCSPRNKDEALIEVPGDAKSFTGKDYKEVETEFKDAGFTDITFKKVPDLVLGLIHGEGDVISVHINGFPNFREGDAYVESAKILITYHTFPESSKSHSDRVN